MVIAGNDYGMGSSRDWAAKGTQLQGVKAVIAESFEWIHRINLVGMGILPLQFKEGENAEKIGLNGSETYEISGIKTSFNVIVRLDSQVDVEYYKNGGILHTVLRNM